jgi:ABC-2 type transport system permease protein
MSAFWQLVRNDLKLYFSNRRALLMNLLAPIVIAAFFGSLFGANKDEPVAAIPVAVTDQDGSAVSKKIVAALAADKNLAVQALDAAAALERVRAGKLQADVVIPRGFGAAAGTALFSGRDKPQIVIHYDPSQTVALQVVRGMLAQSVMQNVSAAVFSMADETLPRLRANVENSSDINPEAKRDLRAIFDSSERLQRRAQQDTAQSPGAAADAGNVRPALSLPYTLSEQEVRAHQDVPYNSYAHAFAGMGVQFTLMMGVEVGVGLLLLRRLGLWRRLRAAPLGKGTLLGSRVAMCAIAAFTLMLVIYAVAMLVFKVRVQGSWPGFIGVLAAFSLMTAALGMLVAALGKTPEATRGLAIFLTLILVMLGGAWVPSFVFPAWLQKLTAFVPTRWAIDGLDAVTWRGLGLEAAGFPILAMSAFAALCLAFAVRVFDWEE